MKALLTQASIIGDSVLYCLVLCVAAWTGWAGLRAGGGGSWFRVLIVAAFLVLCLSVCALSIMTQCANIGVLPSGDATGLVCPRTASDEQSPILPITSGMNVCLDSVRRCMPLASSPVAAA